MDGNVAYNAYIFFKQYIIISYGNQNNLPEFFSHARKTVSRLLHVANETIFKFFFVFVIYQRFGLFYIFFVRINIRVFTSNNAYNFSKQLDQLKFLKCLPYVTYIVNKTTNVTITRVIIFSTTSNLYVSMYKLKAFLVYRKSGAVC